MSERRHRSSGGGRAKQVLAWAGWGMLIALLGTNLVMAFLNEEQDGTPQGFFTIELLQIAGFWAPMALAWLFALLGLLWVGKAYKHSERASLLWAKRGYAFAIVGGLAFAIAVFEPELLDRRWLAVAASSLFGAQTVFFALLARAEYRRAETGEGTRHPRRHGERSSSSASSVPAVPPAPAGPAESPGAGR